MHRVADPRFPELFIQLALVRGEPLIVDHPNLENRCDRVELRERELHLAVFVEGGVFGKGWKSLDQILAEVLVQKSIDHYMTKRLRSGELALKPGSRVEERRV